MGAVAVGLMDRLRSPEAEEPWDSGMAKAVYDGPVEALERYEAVVAENPAAERYGAKNPSTSPAAPGSSSSPGRAPSGARF